ncbi:virulence-associated protein VagC [Pseudomonas nitritireducens]|uniref:Virulence-associated protein VagC n=1 Tax=Pseudomonas nitroreducens TaxID=46680 RepID=A0A7W7KR26_PSENT|nr:hypothetical protein [Pseudomonas nitritireducens]MBB4867404.1 virulence-associated protein VagC [Pseudomonas nitritireducens]
MHRVPVIQNGDHQEIHLPRELFLPHDLPEGQTEGEFLVEIEKVGDTLTIRPLCSAPKPSWDTLFDLPPVSDDFLEERPSVIGQRD